VVALTFHNEKAGHSVNEPRRKRGPMMALLVAIVLLSTALLAASLLHDRLVPEPPYAEITLEKVSTEGLGGTEEHPHLVRNAIVGELYDLGVHVEGLHEKDGVLTQFFISRTGLNDADIEAWYYDVISSSWRALDFMDKGNTLVASLGPAGGVDIDDDYEAQYMLIISLNTPGTINFGAYTTLTH
jgi:hypothetical protein